MNADIMRWIFLALALAVSAQSIAQTDVVARTEILHLKELLAAADRRYEQRFDAQEKAVQAALNAAKDAVNKAEQASEKRLDSVNEFRAQLRDQAGTFVTRSELWGYFIGSTGLLLAVVGLALRNARRIEPKAKDQC